jgi:acetolactate synthase-1/2/3 large subunit
VRVVFGLPGVQLYGAMAALREEPRIRFIATRHEQATTYMADGYARTGGGFGTALVVPGPGLLNASAGLSTAYSASSPVLLVCGQIPRERIGKRVGVLHEIDDQLDAVAAVTTWRRRVLEVEDIPGAVAEAARRLRTGRPRPVAIEIPPETLAELGDVDLLDSQRPEPRAAAGVERAAALLDASERPVIYVGGGVHSSGAHDVLARVAGRLEAGVVTSAEGKGALDDRDDLSLGATPWPFGPLRRHLDEADVILAVGTRFATASPRPEQQVVQIDVDEEEVGRNHARTLRLVGDARATLELLLERLAEGRPSRAAEREALRAEVAALATDEPQASILASLRAALPDNTIVVADMTQIGYYAQAFWPVYEPRSFLTSSYSGNLGFAYPTALGAKVANPERPVVSLSGDGGFLFNSQELATAVQYGIDVVAVVFNDNSYGNVARDLGEAWGGSYGAELGVRAVPADVGPAVARALGARRPALVEVPVSPMPRPRFFPPLQATRR